MRKPTAFFVFKPSRLDDLKRLHPIDARKPYIIENTVELARIDYENFITDLCVDRWFIEENASLCRVDDSGVWHCILVCQKGRSDGVLVMSDGYDYPRWAAYLAEAEEKPLLH
jgi:hypothetical protein